MKVYFILPLLIFLLSCERHIQENIVVDNVIKKEFNLKVIDQLSKAITVNDSASLRRILEEGNFELNGVDESGKLLLNKAIIANSFKIAEILIEYGADPDFPDGEEITANQLVENSVYSDEWKLVLTEGRMSKHFAQDKAFEAIEEATSQNEDQKIELLKAYFDYGAPFEGINQTSYTYLMLATSKNLFKIINFLCEYPEIDPNREVEVIKRRRTIIYTALYFATNQEVKDALYSCGARE